MSQTVGMLGIGIMGSAMSANLMRAGFEVVGYDVLDERLRAFAGAGGIAAHSLREVAERAEILISVLPSAAALDAVAGPDGICAAARPGLVLVESSTLPIEDKQRARDTLAAAGVAMLDCPLSGTGAQAVTGDLSVYGSGERAAYDRCLPVFAGFARSTHYLGEFGNGSRMKFVANLMVAIHNASAAEAFVLGMKAGLDPKMIYDVIADGAGSSRMFEVRGPMMVRGDYEPATMKVQVWQKDMKIIGEFARELDCPTPLLSTSAALYTAAMAQGRGTQDTAAVCAVLEEMARLRRPGPA
jgi:putative dehydrogenase